MKPLHELLSLRGRVVLITGGAMGIGRAIAERYAEAGARLQLVDVNAAALHDAAHDLKSRYQVEVQTFVVDLADSAALTACWDSLSPLPDVLVNNAGIFGPRKLERITDADFARMLDINTRAVLINCREFIARRTSPGTIINIASIEARLAMTDNMTLYGISKAGVAALSRALVRDYASKGWRINTILPGGINTPGGTTMVKTALKQFDFSVILTSLKFKSRMPTRGIGQPDDIARAALWLGTPASQYMNGAEVVIDGGFLAV